MRPKSILMVLAFFLSMTARADEFQVTEKMERSRLSLLSQFGSMTLGGQSLTTQGIQIQYGYSVFEKLQLEGFIATALSLGNSEGLSSTFTGLGLYAFYPLLGRNIQTHKQLLLNSKSIYSEVSSSSILLLVGAGLDNYMLNGSKGIYSSTGAGVEASCLFPIWGYTGRANLKYTNLEAGGKAVEMMFADLGLSFLF
ncbi:MAG: hypothetical protein ACM3MG_13385 [Bacillota bacterium]